MLADQERVLGANHPSTLATRTDLAHAYREAGRTAEAITLLEQSLADQERMLGPNHPTTVGTRNRLSNVTRIRARTGEALDRQPFDRR